MAEKIHILISLFAAIVVAINCIIYRMDPTFIAYRLIFVICIFYIIGAIYKNYILKILENKKTDMDENSVIT